VLSSFFVSRFLSVLCEGISRPFWPSVLTSLDGVVLFLGLDSDFPPVWILPNTVPMRAAWVFHSFPSQGKTPTWVISPPPPAIMSDFFLQNSCSPLQCVQSSLLCGRLTPATCIPGRLFFSRTSSLVFPGTAGSPTLSLVKTASFPKIFLVFYPLVESPIFAWGRRSCFFLSLRTFVFSQDLFFFPRCLLAGLSYGVHRRWSSFSRGKRLIFLFSSSLVL